MSVGKNVETNSLLVRAKVEEWGGEFTGFQTVRDRPAAIKLALRQACEVADVVVLNAGSFKGSADWTSEVLDEVAHVICHQTNHGSGATRPAVGDLVDVELRGRL